MDYLCHSGEYCAKAIRANWGFDQQLSLEANSEYKLSYWVKSGTATHARVIISSTEDIFATGSRYTNCHSPHDLVSKWVYTECRFTTPDSVDNDPYLKVISHSDPIDPNVFSYVDDIKLTKQGSDENLISNGDFERAAIGFGASLLICTGFFYGIHKLYGWGREARLKASNRFKNIKTITIEDLV